MSAQITINHKKARYVRIELEGYNALSLAEVEVFCFIATNAETATQVSKPVQPISQTPVKDKTLTIQHSGAYIARYSITWEEVPVDKDGNQLFVVILGKEAVATRLQVLSSTSQSKKI